MLLLLLLQVLLLLMLHLLPLLHLLLLIRVEVAWLLECLSARLPRGHHIRIVLEHLIRQTERSLLVVVVRLGALPNVDVPEAEHLVTLDLDLGFPVSSRDCCTVRYVFCPIVRSR